ncbi:MAG: T9SS type A sorting domain-containing protein [Bacteroidales bacterium]|nr:T9SS type A sorting domain-containing protein [Bacteroidales bacterium]
MNRFLSIDSSFFEQNEQITVWVSVSNAFDCIAFDSIILNLVSCNSSDWKEQSPPIRVINNPGTGIFKIELLKNLHNIEIELTDNQGKLVYKDERGQKNTYVLDIRTSPAGMYYLMIRTNGKSYAVKLIKQ